MRRATLIGTAIAALAIAATARSASAEYGAIAYDESSGKRGFAWNYDTMKRAEEAAMRDCSTSACKIVVRFGTKVCAATATPDTGKGFGAASRASLDAAKLASLEDCQKKVPGKCVVQDAKCNR
jgi:hypothetical protein